MDRVLVQEIRGAWGFSRGPHASPEMSDKGSLPVIEGSRDVDFPLVAKIQSGTPLSVVSPALTAPAAVPAPPVALIGLSSLSRCRDASMGNY